MKYIPVIQTEYIIPPDSLMKPCPKIIINPVQSNGELLIMYIELLTQYNICKSKMDSIISYIKQIQKKGAGCSL